MQTRSGAERRSDATPWPVMVLAHNEEEAIQAALDSILAAESDRPLEIFVIANGCTDRTEAIVRDYARERPEVHLVSIALGDKCNAWNVFIHETVPARCPGREVYFFTCGDVRIVKGSLTALARALQTNPRAHASSAPPGSGRSLEREGRALLEEHALVAGLYALRGSFVERLQELSVRIPLNLEGDDGLIGALVKWDLSPRTNQFDLERIVPCKDAAWVFDSLSLLRIDDWKFYWKRALRYARRRYEFQLLGTVLKSRGLAGLPTDIRELYRQADSLPLRWQGLYTLTSWIALRRMRRIGKSIKR